MAAMTKIPPILPSAPASPGGGEPELVAKEMRRFFAQP